MKIHELELGKVYRIEGEYEKYSYFIDSSNKLCQKNVDDCCTLFSPLQYNEVVVANFIEVKHYSEEFKQFLRLINTEFKYVTVDSDGSMSIYHERPMVGVHGGDYYYGERGDGLPIGCRENFKGEFPKFEDGIIEIEDVLKNEKGD